MLENLVESKNNSKAVRKLYGFLFSTFLVVATILVSATIWSLFAKDFVMGNDDMSLSALITPIPVADDIPKPEPEKPKQQNEPQNAKPQIAVRQTNMARIDEVQRVPDKVSVVPNTNKARPNEPFEVRPNAVETNGSFTGDNGRGNSKVGEIGFKNPTINQQLSKTQNRIFQNRRRSKKPKKNRKFRRSISIGVLNGKATSLPKPPYPLAAKAVGASGAVNVQVTIDEQGNVISAKAVSGHPLLRDVAERAARSARFSPTYLSKVAVKVNGLIVYNFTR